MDPVTIALLGASLAGGIISSQSGKKEISPEWLKQHFGADQVNEEMISLFNNIINSPYGQQIMQDAASQGTQFEAALRSGTAGAGLSAGEGGSSGSSIFSDAAAGGATKSLQSQAKAGIFQQVLPVAQSLVQQRLNAYLGQPAMSQPTSGQLFGQALGAAGAAGLSAGGQSRPAAAAPSLPTTALKEAANYTPPAPERRMVSPAALMQSALNTGAVQPVGGGRFRASVGGSVR